MIFTKEWIDTFVDSGLTAEQIADKITMAGLEVDTVSPVCGEFSGVVVAEVKTCEMHPSSDHLHVTTVDCGDGKLYQVVCGAPNCRAGLKTAFSKVGAVLPGITIKPAVLRGVESNGMLCSYKELGMAEESDGIIELPQPYQAPTSSEASEDVYWIIDWYCLSIDGDMEKKLTTYHNYSDGWFLTLPEEWENQLTISYGEVETGLSGYTFSRWIDADTEPESIFTIYAFSGEDRNEEAASGGRFLLSERGDVTYAASFGSCAWAEDLTEEDLAAMFHYIQIDWNSGEV